MLTKPQKKLIKLHLKAQKAKSHQKAIKILAKHKKLSPQNAH